MKNNENAVAEYLAAIGSKGGKARADKYDKETLKEWGKKGGRPPKKGVNVEAKTKKPKGRV